MKLWQCTQCADSSLQTKDMKQPSAALEASQRASDHIKAAAGTFSHRHAEAQPPNECLTDSYTGHCQKTSLAFMLYIYLIIVMKYCCRTQLFDSYIGSQSIYNTEFSKVAQAEIVQW